MNVLTVIFTETEERRRSQFTTESTLALFASFAGKVERIFRAREERQWTRSHGFANLRTRAKRRRLNSSSDLFVRAGQMRSEIMLHSQSEAGG